MTKLWISLLIFIFNVEKIKPKNAYSCNKIPWDPENVILSWRHGSGKKISWVLIRILTKFECQNKRTEYMSRLCNACILHQNSVSFDTEMETSRRKKLAMLCLLHHRSMNVGSSYFRKRQLLAASILFLLSMNFSKLWFS